MLGEKISKHAEKFFVSSKEAEAVGKRLLRNDKFLAPVASFVQTNTMEAINDQRRVDVFGSMSMAAGQRRKQPWGQRLALCTKNQLVQVTEALRRTSTKVLSHSVPAIVLAAAPAKTRTRRQASWTLRGERLTRTPAKRPDATVA